MTPFQAVLVAVAGAVGAVLRHELTTRSRPVRATAACNVAGAAALGAATVALAPVPLVVLGGGLLGATTTFSTWMVQADGDAPTARTLAWPLLLGVAAAAAGRVLATSLGLGS